MVKKNPSELANNPQINLKKDDKTAPVNKVIDNLMITDGQKLELLTRANPTLTRAVRLGYIFNTTLLHDGPDGPEFGNSYVSGSIDQILRMAISMDGRGRQELIDAVDKGGKLPDSYYQNGRNPNFIELDND